MIEERIFEQLCINRFHDNMKCYLEEPDKKKAVKDLIREVMAENGITEIVRPYASGYDIIDYRDVNISKLLTEMLIIDAITLRNYDKVVKKC